MKKEPVIWRAADDELAPIDAVLAVGECAALVGPSGSGKTSVGTALALQSGFAADRGDRYGETCGLRVRPGPVLVVDYEHSERRLVGQISRLGQDPKNIYVWRDHAPLYSPSIEGEPGEGTTSPVWDRLWCSIRTVSPSLIVIDPVSCAFADVPIDQPGEVGEFFRALAREAEAIDSAVLCVAPLTTTEESKVATEDEDPVAVALGRPTCWYECAHGVLYMVKAATPFDQGEDSRRVVLRALKVSYGRGGWSVNLAEQRHKGVFCGFDKQREGAPSQKTP